MSRIIEANRSLIELRFASLEEVDRELGGKSKYLRFLWLNSLLFIQSSMDAQQLTRAASLKRKEALDQRRTRSSVLTAVSTGIIDASRCSEFQADALMSHVIRATVVTLYYAGSTEPAEPLYYHAGALQVAII